MCGLPLDFITYTYSYTYWLFVKKDPKTFIDDEPKPKPVNSMKYSDWGVMCTDTHEVHKNSRFQLKSGRSFGIFKETSLIAIT